MPPRSKEAASVSPSKTSTKRSQPIPKSTRRKARGSDEESEEEYDSDALDDTDDEKKSLKKRKRKSETGKTTRTPKKKKTDDLDDEFELQLEEGQEIAGVIVQAPKTGRVPPGQISQNTFDFLTQLADPECNDREWYHLSHASCCSKAYEFVAGLNFMVDGFILALLLILTYSATDPVYRQAEKEWKDFVEAFTELLVEVDDQIPPLPPKDLIHRIYRDIRFSNDKTPYKTEFSASFSRGGRKGIFAHFRPGNQSMIAVGTWCPGKNELNTIRSNILRDSTRLRRIISDATFVKYCGEPKPGARRNIFGREDELKVAPKGVDKAHPFVILSSVL
ncbi:hypothetical protein GGX14DRAFT_441721 [Mycena pura]|uniref:Uncharacterized protein n=1 Tax=Mycena pura TaxID=153505 RepID=A0AAD6VMZ6_9AGAR|nr:hypothetical protein GGX14DRAFT_441721 [Mycena pura]